MMSYEDAKSTARDMDIDQATQFLLDHDWKLSDDDITDTGILRAMVTVELVQNTDPQPCGIDGCDCHLVGRTAP